MNICQTALNNASNFYNAYRFGFGRKVGICRCQAKLECRHTASMLLHLCRYKTWDVACKEFDIRINGIKVIQPRVPVPILKGTKKTLEDPRPNVTKNPPRWEAVADYPELKPYFDQLVELWKATGVRSLRLAFKEHDLLAHVIGGALPTLQGEDLAIVAEVMLKHNLNPYEAVYQALLQNRESNPAAGNLLPFHKLERGHTTIQRLIEFAESIEGVYEQHPVAKLLELVSRF